MSIQRTLFSLPAIAALTALAGCSGETHGHEADHVHVDLDDLHAWVIADGLTNPSGLTMHPDGLLTICDGGNGRVLVVGEDGPKPFVTGFATEYWKPGKDGAPDRFKLGPLAAVWIDAKTLAVSNGGLKDGEDNVLFFTGSPKDTKEPLKAESGKATNGIAPTSDDPADKGEGNLTGFSNAGKTIYIAGQGADAKTWLLRCDAETKKLETFASADENGISTNSPMDTILWDDTTLLVVYSGAGGKEDGLLVAWDIETKKPKAQWTLPGLVDPMGIARKPGTDTLFVVDNNWALEKVNQGALAKVTLPEGGGEAKVEVLTRKLLGPVDCCFGKDNVLYVSQLGEEFDKDKGMVLAIDGL
jgi:hypothetical protein